MTGDASLIYDIFPDLSLDALHPWHVSLLFVSFSFFGIFKQYVIKSNDNSKQFTIVASPGLNTLTPILVLEPQHDQHRTLARL